MVNEDIDLNNLEEDMSENYHTREPDTIYIIDFIFELNEPNENNSKRDKDYR